MMLDRTIVYLPGRIRYDDKGQPLRDPRGHVLREPPEPAPALLDEEQATRLLCLDDGGPKDVQKSLIAYRNQMKLRAARIGKWTRYPLQELLRFIEMSTEGSSANRR